MRPPRTRVHLVLLYSLVAMLVAACTVNPSGGRSSSLVFDLTVRDEAGHATAMGRTDFSVTILFGQGQAEATVWQKPSPSFPNGLPVFGPLGASVGKVYVFDHHAKKRYTLDAGRPLPLIAAPLFRPTELEALGMRLVGPADDPIEGVDDGTPPPTP